MRPIWAIGRPFAGVATQSGGGGDPAVFGSGLVIHWAMREGVSTVGRRGRRGRLLASGGKQPECPSRDHQLGKGHAGLSSQHVLRGPAVLET